MHFQSYILAVPRFILSACFSILFRGLHRIKVFHDILIRTLQMLNEPQNRKRSLSPLEGPHSHEVNGLNFSICPM